MIKSRVKRETKKINGLILTEQYIPKKARVYPEMSRSYKVYETDLDGERGDLVFSTYNRKVAHEYCKQNGIYSFRKKSNIVNVNHHNHFLLTYAYFFENGQTIHEHVLLKTNNYHQADALAVGEIKAEMEFNDGGSIVHYIGMERIPETVFSAIKRLKIHRIFIKIGETK